MLKILIKLSLGLSHYPSGANTLSVKSRNRWPKDQTVVRNRQQWKGCLHDLIGDQRERTRAREGFIGKLEMKGVERLL
jgi:hypothetical protein